MSNPKETYRTLAMPLTQHQPNIHPEYYRTCLEGQRVIRLVDEGGNLRGDLVWRYASGGTAEICDIEVFSPGDYDKGFGTRLMEAAIADMQAFFMAIGEKLTRVWLLMEAGNQRAHAFYLRRGFLPLAELPGFYPHTDARLFLLTLEEGRLD